MSRNIFFLMLFSLLVYAGSGCSLKPKAATQPEKVAITVTPEHNARVRCRSARQRAEMTCSATQVSRHEDREGYRFKLNERKDFAPGEVFDGYCIDPERCLEFIITVDERFYFARQYDGWNPTDEPPQMSPLWDYTPIPKRYIKVPTSMPKLETLICIDRSSCKLSETKYDSPDHLEGEHLDYYLADEVEIKQGEEFYGYCLEASGSGCSLYYVYDWHGMKSFAAEGEGWKIIPTEKITLNPEVYDQKLIAELKCDANCPARKIPMAKFEIHSIRFRHKLRASLEIDYPFLSNHLYFARCLDSDCKRSLVEAHDGVYLYTRE